MSSVRTAKTVIVRVATAKVVIARAGAVVAVAGVSRASNRMARTTVGTRPRARTTPLLIRRGETRMSHVPRIVLKSTATVTLKPRKNRHPRP